LTTLLDPQQHPAKGLIVLYHGRWEEELAIDELKTHQLQGLVLRSQTPGGVVQELYGLLIGHFVLRQAIFQAATTLQAAPLRFSFTATLKILRCRLPQCPYSAPQRQQWYQHLLQEIAQETLPPRRRRINPRVIKRQQSKWPSKRPKHLHPPQPQETFLDSIVMLR
jgi:hypothetical protein